MQKQPEAGAGIQRRVIKKYPNRRLYDTASSNYVTLAAVKQLVVQGEPLVVRDAKTGEDLTRSILMQIILEEEAGSSPMFSEQVLASFIRLYGQAMQGYMGPYLERNIEAFAEMQAKMMEQARGMSPESWAQFMSMKAPAMQGMLGSYIEQSNKMFAQMQDQMQKQSEQMFGAMGAKR